MKLNRIILRLAVTIFLSLLYVTCMILFYFVRALVIDKIKSKSTTDIKYYNNKY